MASLYVTEYGGFAGHKGPISSVPLAPPLAHQKIAIGGTSTASAAFNAQTHVIEVHTDAICSIDIGDDPTATASEMRMAANETRIYGVNPGSKIAVITNT